MEKLECKKRTCFDCETEDDCDIDIDAVLTKNRKRGERRKTNVLKALSLRRKDSTRKGDFPWYNNLHQYVKGKIHCSCPRCRFEGPTYSDMKKNLSVLQQVQEYKAS